MNLAGRVKLEPVTFCTVQCETRCQPRSYQLSSKLVHEHYQENLKT